MHLIPDELFLQVAYLPSGEVAWDRVCGDFRDHLHNGDIGAGRGLALCSLILSLSTQADRTSIEPIATAALAMARESGDEPAMRMALRALVENARSAGRYELALSLTQDLKALGDQKALSQEIELLTLCDRPELAWELIDRADDRFRQDGFECFRSGLAISKLTYDLAFSSLDEAQGTARALLHESGAFACGAHDVEGHLALAHIAQLRGDYRLARSCIASAVDVFDRRGDELSARLSLARASLALREGDNAEAFSLFRGVAEESRRTGRFQPWGPSSLVEATRCAVALNQDSMARDIIEAAEMLRDGTPDSSTCAAVATQTRGLLSGDVEVLREAVQLARRSPRRLVRADALADFGRVLLNHNRVLEAITPLDDAWDLFNDVGAGDSATAIQRLLARAGVRRRRWSTAARRPLEGWGALTDAERRVARLVGEGHTNRSAAAQLGTTPNTVSSQVRSIFGKLGITSRVHLHSRRCLEEAPYVSPP